MALTGTARPQPDGTPGVRSHQLLLAVLGAGRRGRRRDVAGELAGAALRRGSYQDSREGLTPGRGDLLAPVPVAVAALATLAWPPAWRQFAGGSAVAYSLTPAAWAELTAAAAAAGASLTARALVAPGPPPGPGEVIRGRSGNQPVSRR